QLHQILPAGCLCREAGLKFGPIPRVVLHGPHTTSWAYLSQVDIPLGFFVKRAVTVPRGVAPQGQQKRPFGAVDVISLSSPGGGHENTSSVCYWGVTLFFRGFSDR